MIFIYNSVSDAVINGMTNWTPGSFVGSGDGYSEGYAGGQTGGYIGSIYTDWPVNGIGGTNIRECVMSGEIYSIDDTRKKDPGDYKDYNGGLIGYIGNKNSSGTSISTGDIIIDTCSVISLIDTPESYYVGGFIGGIDFAVDMGSVYIMASYGSGNIIAKQKSGGLIGKLEGLGTAFILESYYRGNVSSDNSGGLVGEAVQSEATSSDINLLVVDNSYMAGSVFGHHVAGFVSDIQADISVRNSFAAVNLIQPGNVCTGKGILFGNIGVLPDNSVAVISSENVFYDRSLANGTESIILNSGCTLSGQPQPHTTSSMIKRITYPESWFSTSGAWSIVDNQTYPYLKWQVLEDLTDEKHCYSFKSTEYRVSGSDTWHEFKRNAVLPADGDHSFRFISGEGNNAASAFFPYMSSSIGFSVSGETVMLNGFSLQDTIVAGGISESGIIGFAEGGYIVMGTVYPFVHTEPSNPEFDALFPVTAKLYSVPSQDVEDAIDAILGSSALYTSGVMHYDGSVHVPGTPKHPSGKTLSSNPGEPINWLSLGKDIEEIDTTLLTAEDNIPTAPIGLYRFADVEAGDYILVLSRPGYISRFCKVNISSDGVLGHREIIPGDVDHNLVINAYDISKVNAKYSYYGSSGYESQYDINADGEVNGRDVSMLLYYLGFHIELYMDTATWVSEY